MAGIGRRMTRPKPRLRRICSRRLTTYFSAISFRWQTNRFFRLRAVGGGQLNASGTCGRLSHVASEREEP
jgi:hypothetical protein